MLMQTPTRQVAVDLDAMLKLIASAFLSLQRPISKLGDNHPLEGHPNQAFDLMGLSSTIQKGISLKERLNKPNFQAKDYEEKFRNRFHQRYFDTFIKSEICNRTLLVSFPGKPR